MMSSEPVRPDTPQTADVPYLDPSLTSMNGSADLLARMTLAEKVGQLLQLNAQDDLEDIVVDPARRVDPACLPRADDRGDGVWRGRRGSASLC